MHHLLEELADGRVAMPRGQVEEWLDAMVQFTLDGKVVDAPEGELLVHAAARHGVFIPTLCHDEKLVPYGGCRMCVVGLEGSPRPLPACATRVTGGMVISTNS